MPSAPAYDSNRSTWIAMIGRRFPVERTASTEETAVRFTPSPRLEDLSGTTVGIISNGKEGTAHFFAHLERILRDRFGVANVVQRVKHSLSAPAERAIMDEAATWDAAIAGVGD